MSSVSHLEIMS